MLIDIANLWNEFLVASAISYAIALLLVGLTFIATHTKHLITGAVLALVAGGFGQVSKIVLKISIFLAIARVLLIFI